MATFVEIVKKGQTFICDQCKKEIPAKEIKLQEPTDNVNIMTPMMPFLYVAKDGKITGGSKMARKDLGDKVLGCPYCNATHLFGFNLKS
jgi:hypothetical protein